MFLIPIDVHFKYVARMRHSVSGSTTFGVVINQSLLGSRFGLLETIVTDNSISLVSEDLNITFVTHHPASNSLAEQAV